MYALFVWDPSLIMNLLHRITLLHNHGICMILSLCEYDRVSLHLDVDLVIQHRSLIAMYKQYKCNSCLLLNPPIVFGCQSL